MSAQLAAEVDRLGLVPLGGVINVEPVSEEAITRLEELLGVRLPADYRWFLSTYGQTGTGVDAAVDADSGYVRELDVFLGLDEILRWLEINGGPTLPWLSHESSTDQPKLLAFACDLMGSNFLLQYQTGEILFINADTNQISTVTLNFADLLHRLQRKHYST